MRNLRGKLQRAFADSVSAAQAEAGADSAAARPDAPRERSAPRPRSPALAAALRRHHERSARRLQPVELPPGEDLENAHGACYLRRLVYPLDALHGALPLSAAHEVCWQRMAELSRPKPRPRKPRADGKPARPRKPRPPAPPLDARLADCLFLDTETTGLGGGAGTLVFLTGLGFFTDDAFVLEQVFLRGFSEEAAALAHVAERLAERPWLVSFVGKSFDRHRLASRMVVHRVDAPILTDQHLDLYYLARRAWGDQLPDVKLRTVEEQRLGLVRDDDLPGSEAPTAFLSWIRDRTGPVDRVLEHNRLDVLSLATLLAKLGAE